MNKDWRLTDGTVLLRPLRLVEAPSLLEAMRETGEELSRWMTWYRADYSLVDCENFLRASETEWSTGEAYCFAIFDAAGKRLMGTIALNHLHHANSTANLGYWVRRGDARKGIATRAARLVVAFGRDQLRLMNIRVVVPRGNLASIRVAEKCGARLADVVPAGLQLAGKAHDAAVYLIPQSGVRKPASDELSGSPSTPARLCEMSRILDDTRRTSMATGMSVGL